MVVIKKRKAYILSVTEAASGHVLYQPVSNSVAETEAPWIVTCSNDIAAVGCQ